MLAVENGYAKVKKAPLVECLMCPLCLNLFRDATTVTVCLHTFCKDCIYQKLEEDETYCCPICSVYLGCSPQDKLRPDNNLQELRMKLFPLNKPKEPEAIPAVANAPTRRKERSLSSLVTSTAPVPKKIGGGRSRSSAKKPTTSRITKTQYDEKTAEENKFRDQRHSPEESALLSASAASAGARKQRPSGTELCTASSPQEPSSKRIAKAPTWEALAFLAETADMADDGSTPLLGLPSMKEGIKDKLTARNAKRLRRKARKSFSSEHPKGEGKIHENNYLDVQKHDSAGAVEVQMPDNLGIPMSSIQPELQGSKSQNSPLASSSASPSRTFRRLRPVWFTLLASKDHDGDGFPQIPKSFIHVKDGGLPTFYVNKYLSQKLNLNDESEVEITCCGQSLDPNAPLMSLADIWLRQYARAGKGKGLLSEHLKLARNNTHNINDFVIVLTYSKKK